MLFYLNWLKDTIGILMIYLSPMSRLKISLIFLVVSHMIFSFQRLLTTGLPISLQIMMFIPTLERLCTEEQKEKWLPLAKSYKLLGTYAQTELGHGTNIRDLKTRADYDKDKDQFILNNSFPDGIKWWPGGCLYFLKILYAIKIFP